MEMSQVQIEQRRREEAMPVLHGMEGRAMTWNGDVAKTIAATTIATLSSLSLDHRSLDRRCRHSSPPDLLRYIPSSAHNDEEEATPPVLHLIVVLFPLHSLLYIVAHAV